MPLSNELQSIGSELSDRTLTMNLRVEGPDIIFIRSCEIMGSGFRNRFSFSNNRRIEEVLVGRLAHAIAFNLRAVPEDIQVLSLPEFLLELPGLALYGAHVMVMEVTRGVRSIILRFKEFIGALNNVFQIDLGANEPAITAGEKLAMNVLEDICLPILNMCHSLTTDDGSDAVALPQHLRERASEFQFQTELLKRYIVHAAFENQVRNGADAALLSDVPPFQVRGDGTG